MKKLATVLLTLLLVIASCLALTACGEDFEGTTMTNWGDIVNGETGSFYAETENYIYYINGIGTTTNDNTFGKPVKGALMCIAKEDIGNPSAKTEIVVPKIFATGDNDAGIYLFGAGKETYVYYTTPNTNKNSSGDIANDEMTFMRTRLDSKETEELFTVDCFDIQYRMSEKDGVVYITYFDDSNSQIKCYNAKSGKTTIVATTDEKTNSEAVIGQNKAYISLDAYKFLPNGSKYQVIYSTTVYSEKYYSAKAAKDGYERATAKYNVVFAYEAGSIGPTIILNGRLTSLTYTFDKLSGDYLFYTATDIYSKTTKYGFDITGDLTHELDRTKLNSFDISELDCYVVSLDEVYVNDTDSDKVYSISLTTNDLFTSKKILASKSNISSILKIDGDTMYVITDEKTVERVTLNSDEESVKITEDTITTTWYNPAFITVNAKNYMFYADNSSTGVEYIKYVDLDGEVETVYTDDDEEEIDYLTLNGQTFIGKMANSDLVKLVENKISAIGTAVLTLEEKDGKLYAEVVDEARNAYDSLNSELKEDVSDSKKTSLTQAEEAVALANAYNKLSNVEKYEDMNQAEKTEFESAFTSAQELRNTIIQKGASYYTTVRDMIETNYKYFYQEASQLFD